MALSVTPTSGEGPYHFTAEFLNKESFYFGYDLQFFRITQQNSCAVASSANVPMPHESSLLIETGEYLRMSPLADGVCATYRMDVLDLSGQVIDTASVNISNLE